MAFSSNQINCPLSFIKDRVKIHIASGTFVDFKVVGIVKSVMWYKEHIFVSTDKGTYLYESTGSYKNY